MIDVRVFFKTVVFHLLRGDNRQVSLFVMWYPMPADRDREQGRIHGGMGTVDWHTLGLKSAEVASVSDDKYSL